MSQPGPIMIGERLLLALVIALSGAVPAQAEERSPSEVPAESPAPPAPRVGPGIRPTGGVSILFGAASGGALAAASSVLGGELFLEVELNDWILGATLQGGVGLAGPFYTSRFAGGHVGHFLGGGSGLFVKLGAGAYRREYVKLDSEGGIGFADSTASGSLEVGVVLGRQRMGRVVLLARLLVPVFKQPKSFDGTSVEPVALLGVRFGI